MEFLIDAMRHELNILHGGIEEQFNDFLSRVCGKENTDNERCEAEMGRSNDC